MEKIWDLQFLLAALGADPAGWVLQGPARRLLLSWPPPWPSSPCFTGRYFNRSRADGKSKSCQSSSLLLNHVQIQVISEDPTRSTCYASQAVRGTSPGHDGHVQRGRLSPSHALGLSYSKHKALPSPNQLTVQLQLLGNCRVLPTLQNNIYFRNKHCCRCTPPPIQLGMEFIWRLELLSFQRRQLTQPLVRLTLQRTIPRCGQLHPPAAGASSSRGLRWIRVTPPDPFRCILPAQRVHAPHSLLQTPTSRSRTIFFPPWVPAAHAAAEPCSL